jgi:(p)ppGpp synthase/HD superfamily hydrolase
MATLIDYGYIDSVLLKAAIVHDLIEDVPDFNRNIFLSIDYESPEIYELVMEVTRNPSESKPDFLNRILESGSERAKILKVADRISNMLDLGFVINTDFIRRYIDETEQYIFPIAERVNGYMLFELQTLVASRRNYLAVFNGNSNPG